MLLWLCCRLAAAAPIGSLVWELPYAVGGALKKKKQNKQIPFYQNVCSFKVFRILTTYCLVLAWGGTGHHFGADPRRVFST